VIITRANQSVHLVIEDNGKGFSLEQTAAESRSGFGLFGISERVRLLGGTSSIESVPGRGTTISISIANQGNQNGQ
jgi:signal transduction histidine kinase